MIPVELEVIWNGSVRDVVPVDEARRELAAQPVGRLPLTVRRVCERCGDSFDIRPGWIRRRRYCSTACRSSRVVRLCPVCGEPFTVAVKRRDQVHCSKRCGYSGRYAKNPGRMAAIGRLGGLKSGAARRRRSKARK